MSCWVRLFVLFAASEFHACPAYSPPATMIFLLFLMFEGLLFALFTSIMFGTQVAAIWHDQTVLKHYESLVNVNEQNRKMLSYWDNSQLSYSSFTYNILHLSYCNVSESVCVDESVWTFSGYWVSEERRSSLGSKVSLEVHPGSIWTFLHSGKNLFIISYEASREWLKISRSGLAIRV